MPKVILIYDDELAESLADAISGTKPNLCLPYKSARKLMEDLNENLRFDLFITDLAVEESEIIRCGSVLDSNYKPKPAVCGEDLGKKVRELHPNVPIITFSVYDYKPYFSSYHLQKPIHCEDILSTINHFLH